MSFKDTQRAFERMADRGRIKQEHVVPLTIAALMEQGAEAFGRAFYGDTFNKAEDEVAARRAAVSGAQDSTDRILQSWEARAKDIGVLSEQLARETIITSLDLPAVLGRARDLVIRGAEEPTTTESALFNAAFKRTAQNFRPMSSLQKNVDTLGLFLQPEYTNVRYEAFTWSEDQYAVAKYSRAIGWTWEAQQNDDTQTFLDESAALGFAARLNRLQVLLLAIVAGTSRTTLTGTGAGAGGPTIANVVAARAALANNSPPRRLGAIAVPVTWEGLANATRDNQFVPASTPAELNPVYSAFQVNVEESEAFTQIMSAAPSGNAADWLAYDNNVSSWLEFAALRGFEGGPRIVFKLPDTRGVTDLGSFDNMTDAMKVVDTAGAKVTESSKVLRIAGA